MDKVIKLNSRQAGPFTSSQNLVDFTIPSDSSYDLSKSYVNIHTKVDVDSSNDGAIYNFKVYWKNSAGVDSEIQVDNVSVVKNVNFSTAKSGMLEDVRRVDILKQNMKAYTESSDEKRGSLYKSLSQNVTRSLTRSNPWVEYNGEGNVKSVQPETFPIQVPLSDILSLGSDVLPMDKLGEGRLHLELNVNKFGVAQLQGAAGDFGVDSYKDFDSLTTPGDITEVTTTTEFKRLADSPYWVGQKLSFTGTPVSGAPAVTNVERVVSGIEWMATGKLQLTLEQSLVTLTGTQQITGLAIDGVNWVGADLSWEYAELVLAKTQESVPSGNITYTSYTVEEDNGNGLKSFQKQYTIEPNSVNVMMMFPDDANDLISKNNDISDYRLRLDNVDLTNRNVSVKEPLQYDRVGMTFNNMGMKLKNLHEAVRKTSEKDYNLAWDTFSLTTIMSPVPLTQMNKLLQFNINAPSAAGNGVNRLFLVKEVVRSIKV